MEAYATAKQLAGFYQMSVRQTYVILHEMKEAQASGFLNVGKLLRAKPSSFERFLKKRMEGKQ